MKHSHFFIVGLMALLPFPLWAQEKAFSVNLEYAGKNERFLFNDPAGRLFTKSPYAVAELRWGLTLRWYASKRLHTEIGALFMPVLGPTVQYQFPEMGDAFWLYGYYGSRPQFVIRQFYAPLVLGEPGRFEVSVGPFAGLSLQSHQTNFTATTNRTYEGFTMDSRGNRQPEQIRSEEVTRLPNSTTYAFETGVHLNAFVGSRWHVRYQGSWQWGIGTLIQSDVIYSSSLDPTINRATITGKGSGFSHGLTVGYMFGQWRRDDEE